MAYSFQWLYERHRLLACKYFLAILSICSQFGWKHQCKATCLNRSCFSLAKFAKSGNKKMLWFFQVSFPLLLVSRNTRSLSDDLRNLARIDQGLSPSVDLRAGTLWACSISSLWPVMSSRIRKSSSRNFLSRPFSFSGIPTIRLLFCRFSRSSNFSQTHCNFALVSSGLAANSLSDDSR